MVLKQHDYSVTYPRKVVFDTLLSTEEPVNMSKLVRMVSEKIDRATVYRTIDVFEKTGIVNRIQTGWKYKLELSDKFLSHHHHLTCTKCGNTESFHETKILINELNKLASKNNFRLQSHMLELNGICSNCLNGISTS
jgi:Fur family ferric uptake transcriptional regulator